MCQCGEALSLIASAAKRRALNESLAPDLTSWGLNTAGIFERQVANWGASESPTSGATNGKPHVEAPNSHICLLLRGDPRRGIELGPAHHLRRYRFDQLSLHADRGASRRRSALHQSRHRDPAGPGIPQRHDRHQTEHDDRTSATCQSGFRRMRIIGSNSRDPLHCGHRPGFSTRSSPNTNPHDLQRAGTISMS